jgi:hypothetical protein
MREPCFCGQTDKISTGSRSWTVMASGRLGVQTAVILTIENR